MADCLCESKSYSSPSFMFMAAPNMLNTDAHTIIICAAQCTKNSFCRLVLMLTSLYNGVHHQYLTLECPDEMHAVQMQSHQDRIRL